MRILFTSDIHGADLILRKCISAVRKYDVDLLIISGDLTAKDIRPIIRDKKDRLRVNYNGKNETVHLSDLPAIKKKLADLGHYYIECTKHEFEELKADESKVTSLINRKSIEKITEWCETISSRIDLSNTSVIISPGNDDIMEIDDVLQQYAKSGIYSHLDDPHLFGQHEFISIDYSNVTPWNTAREATEEELWEMIIRKVNQLKNPERSIFNFHCPPNNTKLDLGPNLDKNLKPVVGHDGISGMHIGSASVRKSLEEFRPLLGLHGHVHEASGFDYIGNTLCLNPGSEYWNGTLNGYIIDIDDNNISKYYRIEG